VLAGLRPIHASRKQLVIVCVVMPDGRRDSGCQRMFFQIAACCRAADAATSSYRRVFRDGARLSRRAAGEENKKLLRHARDEFAILLAAKLGGAGSRGGPLAGVFRALGFSFLQSAFLHENPLPLVAAARFAKSNHYCCARAILRGSPRQGGVAGRKILQIA
jgi:hypothetical protein